MKKIIKYYLLLLPIVFALWACDSNKDPKATGRFESVNSGTFTCYVDESVWDYLQPVFKMYDSSYIEIHPNFVKSTSREAMAMLLSGSTDAIITPRDYLSDEDSLMKVYRVKHHQRAVYAYDGLIFFTNKDFPLDTLKDDQLKDILTNKSSGFKKYYPKLQQEPIFVCADYNSSEFANLKMKVLKSEPDYAKIKFVKTFEDVEQYIYSNPNAIGIGYMSNTINDEKLKGLRISFTDSSGKYIFPHVIHQANIVRDYYPYIVNHFVYIKEDRRDRVFWFAKFLERETIVQKYFNNTGIVPAYANIRLVETE